MAEMNLPQKGRRSQTPRIDLTPMVDLGFLLITFFMYTTTLAKPATMELKLPSNEPTTTPTTVVAESTITLITIKDHRIVYYEGMLDDATVPKQCSFSQLRSVLLDKKSRVISLPLTFSPAAHKMYALIKPGDNSTYEDLVQLLDEMIIDVIPLYTIMDVSPEEKEWLMKNL